MPPSPVHPGSFLIFAHPAAAASAPASAASAPASQELPYWHDVQSGEAGSVAQIWVGRGAVVPPLPPPGGGGAKGRRAEEHRLRERQALSADAPGIERRVVLVRDHHDDDERVGAQERTTLGEDHLVDAEVRRGAQPDGRAELVPGIGLDEEAIRALEGRLDPAPALLDRRDDGLCLRDERVDALRRVVREKAARRARQGAAVDVGPDEVRLAGWPALLT
jgi:hypothetical protein